MTPTFTVASPQTHRGELTAINVEYMSWVASEIRRTLGISLDAHNGMPLADYVDSVLDKVCGAQPPHGVFYLLHVGDELAGMGGLRFLREGVAEIKRIYMRPAFRGAGCGAALVQRLLDDARGFGFAHVCLDSAPFQRSAHKLYEAFGFRDCKPYDGTEVPAALYDAWRFMSRAL